MPGKLSAAEAIDRWHLELRSRILDLAAGLDRIDHARPDPIDGAAPPVTQDPRLSRIREALRLLTDGRGERTVRVQHIFSDPYDPGWRSSP
ncbi:MAG: hypothetical protein BroJett005_31480 [Ignavibacteriota bacterium]|nr:MAG: hypothetical protein BroJett005_31480 [Ignavibacteriota bacterium]